MTNQLTAETSLSTHESVTTQQYLTFLLAGEEYGVNILRVQEIRGWGAVTEIPNTPSFFLGVINLRGTVVPIVDLRKRFQLPAVEYSNTTVVIVLRVHSVRGQITMGFVVDAVSDVYNLGEEHRHAAPDFGTEVAPEFIGALATVDSKMVILLDIDRLVDKDTVALAADKPNSGQFVCELDDGQKT